MLKDYLSYFIIVSLFILSSCKSDDDPSDYIPISPVNYDAEVAPYNTLSEYNFFEGELSDMIPVLGVLPYQPISQLFSDYAHKKRFVWMPDEVSATYQADSKVFDFPVSTILIKSFYYDNALPENATRIIETRLMIKKETGWVFANYVWNEEQTEAILDTEGSNVDIEWMDEGITKNVNYRIPSNTECLVCHKNANIPTPIGVKPQNINSIYTFEDGDHNQLEKWVSVGYLDGTALPTSDNIETVIDWKDNTHSLSLRVRSYLDINCAHCHIDDGHCSYRVIRLGFSETVDEVNMGVCVDTEENIGNAYRHIISPGRSNRSAMYFRMNTEDDGVKMPLLGRNSIHLEGVELMDEWIESLTTTCN